MAYKIEDLKAPSCIGHIVEGFRIDDHNNIIDLANEMIARKIHNNYYINRFISHSIVSYNPNEAIVTMVFVKGWKWKEQ